MMLCGELILYAKYPSTMVGSLKIWTANEGEMGEKAEAEWFSMSMNKK
jgi:hypothetical protein